MATNSNYDILNAGADQIWTASTQRYNQAPNLQVASDALQVNAGSDIAAALENADPNSDSTLLSSLLGGTIAKGDGSFTIPRVASSKTASNAWNYDRTQYQQAQDAALSKNGGLHDTFADVNGIPIANVQYANDTIYWANKDPGQARAWQQHLIDAGIYQDNLFGKSGRDSADGKWSASDNQALYLYLARLGEPDAMFSKDLSTQQNAATAVNFFYNQVGLTWTSDGIRKAIGNDAKLMRTYQDGIFQGWLQAHPYKRSDGGAQQGLLNEYVDLYGGDALPKEIADMANDGGAIGHILSFPSDIIGALRQIDPSPTNLSRDDPNRGGGILGFGETPSHKEMRLHDVLTKEEQALMAPVVSKIAAGQDYAVEVGNWWGHQVTKLQLTPIYMVGDLIGGKDGHISNPFDNVARAWSGATANEDNLMVGLFGQEWVNAHPDWAHITNFGASFLDPTLLVGAAGRLATFGSFTRQLERASAISRDALVKNGVPIATSDKLNAIFRPKNAIARIRDAAMPSLIRGAANAYDRSVLLGVASDPEARARVSALFHDEQDGTIVFKKNLTDQEITDIIRLKDNGLDHVLHGSADFYNFKASVKMMQANMLHRLDSQKMLRMWLIGGWDFGHQTMHFENDFRLAIEKMVHEGALFKMPEDHINGYVDAIMADHTAAVDVAMKFYDELTTLIPKDVQERLAELRKSEWTGQIPDSIRHKYAIDPRGPNSPTGTREISTAPLKVPTHLEAAYQAGMNGWRVVESGFMAEVKAYQQRLGFAMGGSPEANEPIIQRFLSDPANKAISDKFLKDKMDHERAMTDLLGTSQGEIAVPMIEAQLAKIYHAPFSTWELIVAAHGKLAFTEKWQGRLGADAIMNFWKLYTLAKPSSAARALTGDDSLRVAVTLAFAGSAKDAAREMTLGAILRQPLSLLDAAYYLVSPLAKGIFGVGDKLRQEVFTKIRERTGMTHQQAVDASEGFYARKVEYLGALAPEMKRLAEMSDHTGGFHPTGPEMPGHVESLGWWIRNIGAGPGREWSRIFDAVGEDAARDWLVERRLKGMDAENLRLQAAKGATKADLKVMQDAEHHQRLATQFQADLDAMDASMPRYTRGPRKGQPNFQARQYQLMYASMRKLIPPGLSPAGFTGSYRDRVLDLIKHHTDMANDFPQIVMEQARAEHDFYKEFAALPEIRDMVKAGQVNEKVIRRLTKDSVTRPKLPWVVAMEDTPETRSHLRWMLERPADVSMEGIFRPLVTVGRAEAMSGIHRYWRHYLAEFYKNEPNWDQGRIERAALAQAQDWMRHNTYQGARSVGSYAFRNAFPFSGSVMNQDQFWLNTFKTHPWAAGVAAKLGIDMDAHRHDRVQLPNPLGWAHIGGDQLSINPWGISFVGSEGMGSFVAGLGPFATPLGVIASKNAYAKQVIDMIPGWGEHIPGDISLGSVIGGAVPSYLRKPIEATGLALGLPKGMVPGAEKDIADRTRLDQAMGERPTEDQVRHEVSVEGWGRGFASWVLPFQPHIGNPTEDLIKKAGGEQAKGVDIATLRKDPAFAGIAPYLEYRDQTTSPQRRDQLVWTYPELLAWTAPATTTKGTVETSSPHSFKDWQALKAQEGEHFLSAGEIDREIVQAYQTNQFSQAYHGAYAQLRDEFLAEHRVGQSSKLYKDFKATTLDPIMERLKLHYPLGYEKFVGGSRTLNQQSFTNAIGSLNSFFHMPTTAALDSQGVNNWRVVSDLVQQTVTNIVEAKHRGANAVQLQAISQQFHQAIVEQFGGDPTFLDEIGFRYHWSSWVDFLTTNANQEIKSRIR